MNARTDLIQILDAAGEPAASSLTDPNLRLVVAGQQPAVAGGPLYGLVKACHALAEADRLSMAGQPHRALFWVASEDHDLGEAACAHLLRRDGALAGIRSDLGPGRASLRFRPARTWWPATLAACERLAGPALGAAWLRAQAPEADEGMGTWTCRILRALLPGLLAIEGHHLRSLWIDAARTLTREWPAEALWSTRRAVLAAGGSDALGILDLPPWFADRPDGRIAIASAAALDLLDQDPGSLSPGAAIRPILQQAALPCSTFIAGPGERAYHALIGSLYQVAGVTRPTLVPRVGITLLPGWWRRSAARPNSSDALAEELLALAPVFARLRAQADSATASRLAQAATQVDRAIRTRERHQRTGQPSRGVLAAWERPRNRPQDRTLTLVQAVWHWGPGIAGAIRTACTGAAPGDELRLAV